MRRLTRKQALRMSRQRRDPVRLSTNQVLTIEVAHIQTLDELVRDGSPQALWDWVANVYTWSRVAELMKLGTDEMEEQLKVCVRLLERYRRTGRVAFDGPDYQLAKHGVDVMDELARQVPQPVAIAAARWSEQRLAPMRATFEAERKVA